VVGCVPPVRFDETYVRVLPALRKDVPAERERLSRLFLDATFLLLPTRAECFGMVFCEASAHGTPSVATDTGGVRGAVEDGENGILLPLEAGAIVYAEVIARLFADCGRYDALVRSSRAAYESRLNWDSWGRRMAPLLTSVIEARTRR
jgi:glycosyltransferase involved in cell wall biosynthesis